MEPARPVASDFVSISFGLNCPRISTASNSASNVTEFENVSVIGTGPSFLVPRAHTHEVGNE